MYLLRECTFTHRDVALAARFVLLVSVSLAIVEWTQGRLLIQVGTTRFFSWEFGIGNMTESVWAPCLKRDNSVVGIDTCLPFAYTCIEKH